MAEKMEWLKTDPENGMLIGPDGCHYESEKEAAHYALLHLCGCGNPEEAYNFCRAALMAFDRRDGSKRWVDAEAAIEELVKAKPDIAAHVLSHMLNHYDLLEHGGSVGGSWLTENGERIVDMGDALDEASHDR